MARSGRVWSIAAGVGVLAAGAVGVVHMPAFRGLLTSAGECPVGHATAAQLDPVRLSALAKIRGTAPAPARPALGFELDRTSPADVQAWAARTHVTCTAVRDGLLQCRDVPPSALGLPEVDGPVAELHLGFDSKGHLVDVSTIRMHVEGLDGVRDIEQRLRAQIGTPQKQIGRFDAAHLSAAGVQSLSSLDYRYSNYVAEVIAMRFPTDGLVLREHYVSAAD